MPIPVNVTSQSPLLQQNAACIYCHADIAVHDQVMLCDVCHSPHHVECWKSNGNRCATFGCDFADPIKVERARPTFQPLSAQLAAGSSTIRSTSTQAQVQSRSPHVLVELILIVFCLFGMMIPCSLAFYNVFSSGPPRGERNGEMNRKASAASRAAIATRVASYTPDPLSARSTARPTNTPIEREIPPVHVGSTDYRIIDVWDQGPDLDELRAEGRFVVLHASIVNRSRNPEAYQTVRLADSQGKIHVPIQEAARYISSDLICDRRILYSELEYSCMMVFDVDSDETVQLSLLLTDLGAATNEGDVENVPLPNELKKFRWRASN